MCGTGAHQRPGGENERYWTRNSAHDPLIEEFERDRPSSKFWEQPLAGRIPHLHAAEHRQRDQARQRRYAGGHEHCRVESIEQRLALARQDRTEQGGRDQAAGARNRAVEADAKRRAAPRPNPGPMKSAEPPRSSFRSPSPGWSGTDRFNSRCAAPSGTTAACLPRPPAARCQRYPQAQPRGQSAHRRRYGRHQHRQREHRQARLDR